MTLYGGEVAVTGAVFPSLVEGMYKYVCTVCVNRLITDTHLLLPPHQRYGHQLADQRMAVSLFAILGNASAIVADITLLVSTILAAKRKEGFETAVFRNMVLWVAFPFRPFVVSWVLS